MLPLTLVAAFMAGGAAAWAVQGYRLDAVSAGYRAFVSTTAVLGEAAKKAAVRQAALDQSKKEQADHENKIAVAALRADIVRLRNTRASGSFVPATAATPGRPELACFDRSGLESAIRVLDRGVQGLVDEGSEATVNLDTAKRWAAAIK